MESLKRLASQFYSDSDHLPSSSYESLFTYSTNPELYSLPSTSNSLLDLHEELVWSGSDYEIIIASSEILADTPFKIEIKTPESPDSLILSHRLQTARSNSWKNSLNQKLLCRICRKTSRKTQNTTTLHSLGWLRRQLFHKVTV